MNWNFHFHYYFGLSPDKVDKLYLILSQVAWICACCFVAVHNLKDVDDLILIFRFFVPFLFLQPIYTVAKDLVRQWKKKEMYVWDVMVLLGYSGVAILVATNEFYIREEWVDRWIDAIK